MTRTDLAHALRHRDLSQSPAEAVHRERMLALLESTPDCFVRSSFPAHFTGSALVLSHDGSQALLNHHRTLNRWQQFGGHCDGDENILRVAQREAWEESGVEGLIVTSTDPFDLDIHEIPANSRKNEPAHYHYDVRYVLIAPENATFKVSDESHDLRWVTPDEMAQLCDGDEGLQRMIGKWRKLLIRRAH